MCTVLHFLNSIITHLLHALLDVVLQLLEALFDMLLQVLLAVFLEVLEGVVCIITSQGESTLHPPKEFTARLGDGPQCVKPFVLWREG